MHSLRGLTELSGIRHRSGSIELMVSTAICTSTAPRPWDWRWKQKIHCGPEQIAEWRAWKTGSGGTFRCLRGFTCKTSRQLQRTMKRVSGYLTPTKDCTGGPTAVSKIFRTIRCLLMTEAPSGLERNEG